MDLEERVEHGYADSDGVNIHYASLGSGPLMVMMHGFPDYWYTWRHQMEALSEDYQCVAIDLRGYNLSDKPKGVDNYAMDILVEDVAAGDARQAHHPECAPSPGICEGASR